MWKRSLLDVGRARDHGGASHWRRRLRRRGSRYAVPPLLSWVGIVGVGHRHRRLHRCWRLRCARGWRGRVDHSSIVFRGRRIGVGVLRWRRSSIRGGRIRHGSVSLHWRRGICGRWGHWWQSRLRRHCVRVSQVDFVPLSAGPLCGSRAVWIVALASLAGMCFYRPCFS